MKLKIALFDLNHTTRGIHTNTAPLGLGAIARYLGIAVVSGYEVKIFKDTDKALSSLSTWVPDIAGIAQYSWNSELDLAVARIVKEANPECLIVAGGPNLSLDGKGRAEFFRQYPFVDIAVLYDGEIPFSEIVKRVISGESAASIRRSPGAGTYSYDETSGRIVDSPLAPPRLDSLDRLGPLYADGLFDEFLDDGFHPFLQTHRGCPFTCTFCHTSDRYYSRMLFLSPGIFERDMEYLARRFAGRHEVTIYLANTNMSLFKEDFLIADVIRRMRDKYDWPRLINVNSGKDPRKLLEMSSVIEFNPGIALQTLTPAVLKNINRMNIPLEEFASFQREMLVRSGQTSETELILSLPGETKESFLETVGKVLNSGVQNVCIYTLMLLKGTPLASEENARRYGYVIRHRVVPRQFGIVRGSKVLDTEEVVVGTNTMPFEDYIDLRRLSFTISVFFSSIELVPLKRLLLESKADMADWLFGIHKRLSEFDDIGAHYRGFIRETKDELFPTRQALLDFFSQDENWNALCDGRYGDNLLRKYKQLALFHSYESVLKLAILEASRVLSGRIDPEEAREILRDMASYLSLRDVKKILDDPASVGGRKLELDYDIPSWLVLYDGSSPIQKYRRRVSYKAVIDDNIILKAKEFGEANKDFDLSLQILYRDGSIRSFWPELKSFKKS